MKLNNRCLKKYVSSVNKNIYTISNIDEEKLAVIFAYVSRSPKSFRENLLLCSDLKKDKFHRKYVLEYGHYSVAEHAHIHVGIEKVSRLFTLELQASDKFLSFTEYSQRYQIPKRGAWHYEIPIENTFYNKIFDIYESLLEHIDKEDARYVLPLAMHTNLGMSCNALALSRSLSALKRSKYVEVTRNARDIENEVFKSLPNLVRIKNFENINKYLENYEKIKEIILTNVYKSDIFGNIFEFKLKMSEACFHQFIRHRAFNVVYSSPSVEEVVDLSKYIDNYDKVKHLFLKAHELTKSFYEKYSSDYLVSNSNVRYVICQVDQKGLDHFFKLRINSNSQKEIRILAETMRGKINNE